MKLTADKNGNQRFFAAKLGWKERFDSREIEMLTAGAVPALISPAMVQGRKNNIVKFDISPYSTLEFYLTCILSREQFAEILLQCIDVFRQMQRVYLNYKNLVFDLDKIYIQLENRRLHWIYLPLLESKREASLPEFFKRLIQKASHSTYEQTAFLDAAQTWLSRPAPFILEEFNAFVEGNVYAAASPKPVQADVQPIQAADLYQQHLVGFPSQPSGIPPTQNVREQTQILSRKSDIETVLLGDPETMASMVRFYLKRVQTGETIEITTSPFLVGTEAGSVTYCIPDNAAVSRKHAEFVLRDGYCTIADQKSTNKTYVNNLALTPFIAQKLSDGDQIRLANEKFTFCQEEQE